MTFLEAREALHKGKRMRHQSMPEGDRIMIYRRGWGADLPIMVDTNEKLSPSKIGYSELFWATVFENDEGWEVVE